LSQRIKIKSDVAFIKYLKENGGDTAKKCFQCATCTVSCRLSPKDFAFPRKEMIDASWGLKEKLVGDPDLWLCHGCMDCSEQCPRGARPADLMGAVRGYVYRNYATPRFMGEWLANPKFAPLVFIVPMLFILALVLITNFVVHGGDMNFFAVREGVMKYEDFINKLAIEALFIPGNILIWGLAAYSLSRYWYDMKMHVPTKPKKSFLAAAREVGAEFLFHKKFSACPENSNRKYGHLYAFYGFIGTMIATGLVVVGEIHHYGEKFGSDLMKAVSFHLPYPMNLMHPVKLLGLISGVFLLIGLLLFVIKRIKQSEHDGKSKYQDWLFLWTITGVAATGMLIVFLRMALPHELAFIAYLTYFIHLTLVFILLWFMPYSKFAHIIYRLLGLVFLKMHGRDNKPEVFVNAVRRN
jgi:quinone-modifying oxidoreductase subunit QmoC